MPFKSEAQRRLFWAKVGRGEMKRSTAKHWEKATKGKLPEKVSQMGPGSTPLPPTLQPVGQQTAQAVSQNMMASTSMPPPQASAMTSPLMKGAAFREGEAHFTSFADEFLKIAESHR